MSRPTQPPSPDDPDETPTRIGGNAGAGGRLPDEDPTVPSLQKGGGAPPPPPRQQQHPQQKANDPLIGKELGGCRITGLLGRGAMGAVYKARQLRLDRDVAVKVIRPEMMTDARTLKRFEVEARTVGRFNSAHVVMVHDVGFEQNVHYLVMEFVQGKNLRDHVKLLAGGRLPAAEAIPLLRQACKGLEEAQRLSVIHRDIKPDNLMLTERGILKIADFGIAKPIHEDFSMTLTSELIGTPLYMSPEQCQGVADLDFRSDMYSLGATFYYLLTGEPPVRASSVYELIQTKTKLENLCLWKALPDLDQNHPLSRVIERMTALDRDDRYESYEALLNDIVLVEQGGTVQRMAPRPEKKEMPKLPEVKPKKGNGTAIAAVLGVLAVGGGAYWFATSGEEPKSNDVAGTPVKVDTAVVRGQLTALHERLALGGPSDSLLDDAKKVAAEGPELREKEALLAAIQQASEVKSRLQKTRPPEAIEPPFDTLRQHFEAVDRAVAVEGTPLPSLATWLANVEAASRAEATLGARAQSRLAGAFTKWRDERGKAAGDTTKLALLTEQLGTIEAGRRVLVELMPQLRADLDRDLPVESLDKARRGLTEDTSLPAEVDVAESLAKFRAQFEANGPDAALQRNVEALRPTKVEQNEARTTLMNAIGIASERKSDAERTRTSSKPSDPQLPFDDVESYFQKLDLALEPLQDAAKKLPTWAEALRTNLRDEKALQASVTAACGRAFRSWQQDSAAPGVDRERLASRLALLRNGVERATKLFPAAKADLDREVPAAEIEKALAGLELAAGRQRWLGTVRELGARADAVRTIAEWRAAEAQFAADVAACEAAAVPFATDADVQREQKRITDARNRWATADAKVKELAGKLATGDLTAADALARAGVLGNEGKDELRLFGDAVTRCRDAFAALEQSLDVGKAQTLLSDGKSLLRPVAVLAPEVDRRIDGWIARLGELQQAAAGLVAIPGGRVRGESARVESFFLSPTEVSHGDFTRFLGELKTAVNGIEDPARRLAAVEPRLPGIGLTSEALEALLAIEPRRVGAKLPADRLTWHAAAACAAWSGRSLPTLGEWSLAAFGDGNQNKYPWGGAWSYESKDRNPDSKNLVEVDDGGLSWRAAGGLRVHHLAGNVAEWLHAEPAAGNAMLAGGKFNDSEPNAKARAEGGVIEADKTDSYPGFGARVVLRPRAFPGLDWPR